MVHHRLNEKQTNPNPLVNFISTLPASRLSSQEDAHQLLCALAAQVRPVMKAHGLAVNSLEEYEYNSVFAGRNWNNGETIELVLRTRDGLFLSTSSLLSTFCHELAHIKHMNHGVAFQALWRQLRDDVRNLQNKGYYGDGYWSSGRRLADGVKVAGMGIRSGDLPQYMCGGAHSRSRPATSTRRHARTHVGPSSHTGAQVSKKRKPGTRVTRADAFSGKGVAINSGEADTTKGAGFRKQAGSKRAREERALAAEKRMRTLQAQVKAKPLPSDPDQGNTAVDSDLDPDSETEVLSETDQDRLKALMNSIKDEGSDMTNETWDAYDQEFNFSLAEQDSQGTTFQDVDNETPCDVLLSDPSRRTFTSNSSLVPSSLPGSSKGRAKERDTSSSGNSNSKKRAQSDGLGLGKLVQTEIDFRKKESLGLAPGQSSRRLGTGNSSKRSEMGGDTISERSNPRTSRDETVDAENPDEMWNCLICTLLNAEGHLACSACGTTRGGAVWIGES